MTEHDPKVREALEGIDESKRETLTRLVSGSAFVAPVVASFAMQGISIQPAHAQVGSSSNVTVDPDTTFFSDSRLKRDIAQIASHPSGCGIYRFKYLWSDITYVGVIAQEVLQSTPKAVTRGPGGFLAVDYDALGMRMTREEIGPA
jgi:Chaperone of endosialidase